MNAMSAMELSGFELDGARMTVAEWDALPEGDGYRYELLDGVLFVNAAPAPRHQDVVANLYDALRAACPADYVVRFAPLALMLDDRTRVEPDLMVLRREDFVDEGVLRAIVAVEVLSPSNRSRDLTVKLRKYERSGIAHSWVVDPEEPSLTAWELVDGEYVEAARATGTEKVVVERPFPVEVTPSELLRR